MRALRFAFIALPLSGALLALAPSCFKPDYGDPGTKGYYCHTDDDPACPEGTMCIGGRCVTNGGPADTSLIPKTSSYMGPKTDPMLTDAAMCPDAMLEPNNEISVATDLSGQTIAVNGGPLRLGSLAICPTGDSPTGGHDVDWYKISVPQSVSAIVDITYDVKYGDLDVGIFRPDGSVVKSDGSAVSNGCVDASLQAGDYFIAVVGANNVDVNRYQLSIRYSSSTRTCADGAPDMAM